MQGLGNIFFFQFHRLGNKNHCLVCLWEFATGLFVNYITATRHERTAHVYVSPLSFHSEYHHCYSSRAIACCDWNDDMFDDNEDDDALRWLPSCASMY